MNWIPRAITSRRSSKATSLSGGGYNGGFWLPTALLAGALIALVSCAPTSPRLELDAAMGWQSICPKLWSRWEKLRSVEAEVRYTAETPWGNLSGFGKFALDATKGIAAVELRGPLGVRAVSAFLTPDTAWTYVPVSNYLYYGKPGDGFQGKQPAKTLLALLLGQVPVPCGHKARVRNLGATTMAVGLEEKDTLFLFSLDRDWGDLKGARIETQRTTMRLEYEGYRSIRGVRLPRLVRLTSQGLQLRVAVAFLDVRVNRAIGWQRYQLRIPSTATRVPFSQLLLSIGEASGGHAIGPKRGDD